MKKEPLREVRVSVSLFFDSMGCTWDVRSSVNGSEERLVAMDFCKAPTGEYSDRPWCDTVVDDIVEKAWATAYPQQLQLPFP